MHFTTEKTTKLRITHHAHIYQPLDLCSLFSAFSDPVSNVFLNLLGIFFPVRDHTTIFEKIDYISFFCAGSWGTGGPWPFLKNDATKKLFLQKLFLSTMATFGKCTKKMKHFCKITSPLRIRKRKKFILITNYLITIESTGF